MLTPQRLITVTVVLGFCGAVFAQDVYVFPKANQSKEQTEQDKFQCHSWAKEQSGFDPLSTNRSNDVSDAQQTIDEPLLNCKVYGAGKGAAGGALGGHITGTIVKGDKKRARNIGAVTGAMSGAAKKDQCRAENKARRARNEQRRALAENQSSQDSSGSKDDYVRAYKTCLEAKEYATS